MKQVSKYKYEVDLGEQVDVELSPRGIGRGLIVAALDGRQISQFTEGLTPKYTFRVADSRHFLWLQALFDGTPDAQVGVEISGSDRTKYSGPTLNKDNLVISIEFETRTGGPR